MVLLDLAFAAWVRTSEGNRKCNQKPWESKYPQASWGEELE